MILMRMSTEEVMAFTNSPDILGSFANDCDEMTTHDALNYGVLLRTLTH